MNALLHMGEHSIFIGAAYGITLFVFGINILMTILEKRRVKKILLQHLTRNNSA